MKRDILDYLGNKIGELELSDDTPEYIWTEKLARHAAAPPAKIIKDVTPRQIRQALVMAGITMEQIEGALNNLPEPTKTLAKIEWEYSTLFIRSNPLVNQMAAIIGWTSQQLDQLWELASTL